MGGMGMSESSSSSSGEPGQGGSGEVVGAGGMGGAGGDNGASGDIHGVVNCGCDLPGREQNEAPWRMLGLVASLGIIARRKRMRRHHDGR